MDLFEHEQEVYDDAVKRAGGEGKDKPVDIEAYALLVDEYGKLLKLIRNTMHISDRTSTVLLENNLELEDKVHLDALTGIYSRWYLEDNLKRLLKHLSRAEEPLSVMMVDVDFFKKYNDAYGHGAGDDCLRAIAKALNNSIGRADDFVARYGGEEFVVVLPYTGKTGAEAIAARFLESVRNLKMHHEHSDAADHVTISIGVTTVIVVHNHHYMDYINRADEALYVSKQTGRDKYTFLDYNEKGGGDEA